MATTENDKHIVETIAQFARRSGGIIRGVPLAGWLLISIAMPAFAQTVTPVPAIPADRQVLDVHVGGRVVVHPMPGGGGAYEHQWPGVYFESRFEGPTFYLAFSDPYNEYRLLIDDLNPVTINQPGEARFEVDGLGDGPHAVRLEKVTESIAHAAAFDGFYIPTGERPLTAPSRSRQIEFIGDSSMTGYGDRSDTRTCTSEEVRARTDAQQGYAVLAAKHFNADYRINAWSGRGVVRNYGGAEPDLTLPKVYPFVLFDNSVRDEDKTWQPQIVMLKLDADFATPLKPGEKWATQKALEADYEKAYMAFVTMLHRKYPSAAFVVWTADVTKLSDPKQVAIVEAQEKRLREAATQIGIASIGFIPLDVKAIEGTACDYHGSLADHKRMADAMIAYIDAHPELWDGR